MTVGTAMDCSVDQLALEIFQANQNASVAEITAWMRAKHQVTDQDFVRDVIIHYWHLQQETANRSTSE